MDLSDQITLLECSDIFDPVWYCDTYPDVAPSGLSPVLHYLKYGGVWGRDPGPEFDTRFYQQRYPDVADQKINPLVHFLHQGRTEGRFPSPVAEQNRQGMLTVRKLQAELWGGLSEPAQQALSAMGTDAELPESSRFEAMRVLAIWQDFNGDSAGALRLLDQMGSLSGCYARSALRLIPKSILYARQGLQKKARMILKQITPADHWTDQCLALANLDTAADRLNRVNDVFRAHGLATLSLCDPDQPLALGNLCAGAPPDPETAGMGKVSVIVPAFTASAHIETALRSLCAQSHVDLEIIVVDDCSPDDTAEKVAKLARQDPRIVLLQQTQNGGAYAARNRGLAYATGDFITTHDADDWSHPQKIAMQLKELAREPVLMGVITYWARVHPSFQFTTNWRLGHSLLQWSHSSFLVRRQVPDALGGWEELRVSADMEFIWRVQAAYGAGAVRRILPDIPMAFALDDPGSLTRSPDIHVRSTYFGLRHYYREISGYWHAQAPKGLSSEQKAKKWAMLPEALKPGAVLPIKVDLLLRGDCCDPQVLEQIAQIATDAPGRRIGLVHVPDPTFHDRQYGYAIEFPEAFFTLLMRENIHIACPELQVTVTGEALSL